MNVRFRHVAQWHCAYGLMMWSNCEISVVHRNAQKREVVSSFFYSQHYILHITYTMCIMFHVRINFSLLDKFFWQIYIVGFYVCLLYLIKDHTPIFLSKATYTIFNLYLGLELWFILYTIYIKLVWSPQILTISNMVYYFPDMDGPTWGSTQHDNIWTRHVGTIGGSWVTCMHSR